MALKNHEWFFFTIKKKTIERIKYQKKKYFCDFKKKTKIFKLEKLLAINFQATKAKVLYVNKIFETEKNWVLFYIIKQGSLGLGYIS